MVKSVMPQIYSYFGSNFMCLSNGRTATLFGVSKIKTWNMKAILGINTQIINMTVKVVQETWPFLVEIGISGLYSNFQHKNIQSTPVAFYSISPRPFSITILDLNDLHTGNNEDLITNLFIQVSKFYTARSDWDLILTSCNKVFSL